MSPPVLNLTHTFRITRQPAKCASTKVLDRYVHYRAWISRQVRTQVVDDIRVQRFVWSTFIAYMLMISNAVLNLTRLSNIQQQSFSMDEVDSVHNPKGSRKSTSLSNTINDLVFHG